MLAQDEHGVRYMEAIVWQTKKINVYSGRWRSDLEGAVARRSREHCRALLERIGVLTKPK